MKKYSIVVNILRNVFDKLNFIEIHTQNRLSILTIFDNPKLMCTFNYGGFIWPLPQSNLTWLQYDLLTNSFLPGVYTICTSYKNDPNYSKQADSKLGDTDIVLPYFEFVTFGKYNDMKNLILNVFEELGFGPKSKYNIVSYNDVAKRRGSKEIINNESLSPGVVLLESLSKPIWGVKKNCASHIIIDKLEIATFMEYSTDSNDIIQSFLTINNGDNAEFIYSQFSKERVDNELYKFAHLNLLERVGCSINITNLIEVMETRGLCPLT